MLNPYDKPHLFYFENHSFKSSGSILLPALGSLQDFGAIAQSNAARTTPGFKMDEV